LPPGFIDNINANMILKDGSEKSKKDDDEEEEIDEDELLDD